MPGNYGSYSPKQKKIAKMSGNKKKMEASDFAKLRIVQEEEKESDGIVDIDQLRETLKVDEGVKNEIYLDHLGLPTCGIGHLITEDDPEHGLEVGTHIDDERVNELFDQDVQVTLGECRLLYNDFDDLPEEAQQIIANMMFNMGRPRLSRFHKMKQAVDGRDWIEAGNQMMDSRWYKQVTTRADRLVRRMQAIT